MVPFIELVEKKLDDCLKIRAKQGYCKVGEAVITRAGNLPSNYVIHTVGPVWNEGQKNEDELLANAYRNSLKLAVENHVRSIAFPSISTGIYRFPLERAAKIAVNTIVAFLRSQLVIQEVKLVCFDQENFDIYTKILNYTLGNTTLDRFVDAQADKFEDALVER